MTAKIAAVLLTGVSLAALTSAAQAAVVISGNPTQDMSCSAGVCTPTAKDATLNATELANMLASSDVTVKSNSGASDIDVKAALSWTSGHGLTLNAPGSLTVDQPVTVAGAGGLTISVDQQGPELDLRFGPKGNVTFWDLSSSLTIEGRNYTLVGDIATLAGDIAGNPSGRYALAKSYDASADGTYASAPIPTTFTGTFDGLGNTISNLTIDFSNDTGVNEGLFAAIDTKGAVRSIRLTKATVKGSSPSSGKGVASLAAFSAGFIDGAQADVSITVVAGEVSSGGLVTANYGTISNSFAVARVQASGGLDFLGGLVGDNEGVVSTSYATGSLRATDDGETSMGGLVALNNGAIENAFALSSVRAGHRSCCQSVFGGLVGQNGSNGNAGQIVSSYAGGSVTENRHINGSLSGGLVGDDPSKAGNLSNTYWDLDRGVTNPQQGAGNKKNDSGIAGLTTQQLQSGLPPGFDPRVWSEDPGINNGYPYLRDLRAVSPK
jgi:hypothetical protein